MHPAAGFRRLFAWTYAIAISLVALWFIVLPAANVARELRDPAWRGGAIAPRVRDWHRSLSARFAPWARERVARSSADAVDPLDVSGTEWPLFGAVLYLWATEALERDATRDTDRPSRYASEAIDAAAALVADPGHAAWVRRQWGESYLERENLFYRMLLIAGLDAAERVGGDPRHHALLLEQTRTLATELDASPHGVLDDYPGEAYSTDVLLAYAAIARAQRRLGIEDAAFVARARRAFEGAFVEGDSGLPGFKVDAREGRSDGMLRGVGLAMMLAWAHELWPDLADDWYRRFGARFWQERLGFAGWREFSAAEPAPFEWGFEIDAGPVLAGYGIAANGFGLAAVRARGDADRAWPLTAEALLAAWPLPNGALLGPRIVSNAIDAPYTGEAAVLFALTRTSTASVAPSAAPAPWGVWVVLVILATIGVVDPVLRFRRLLRRR